MKQKVVYESKRPKFAILVDDLNWILAFKEVKRRVWKGGRTGSGWKAEEYHSNIQNLLDSLAERLIKRGTKPYSGFKGIEEATDRVYGKIDKIYKKLSKN